MRVRSVLRLLPAVLGLLLLVLVPAAQAAETLLLSCTVCNQVVATGKGMPPNSQVFLNLVDIKTGQQVGSRHTANTDADGVFVAKIPFDLAKHPSVESTVWKSDGSLLVVAAHNRFTAPCGPNAPGARTLAFTGSHAPQLLAMGAGLLVLGAALILGSRRRRRLSS
jgi:LPXTG-motif cell wall-anchored protein